MLNPIKAVEWAGDLFRSINVPAPDVDPTSWRKAVRAMIILLAAVVGMHLAWSWGHLAALGFVGPAYADEQERILKQVDTKIDEKIKPLQDKIDSTERTSKAILLAIYLPQVRSKVAERCASDDTQEKQEINRELDRIKAEYESLSGEPFGREPSCEQV